MITGPVIIGAGTEQHGAATLRKPAKNPHSGRFRRTAPAGNRPAPAQDSRNTLNVKNFNPSILPVLFLGCLMALYAGCRRKASTAMEFRIPDAAGRTLVISEITTRNGSVFLDSVRGDKKGLFEYRFRDDSLRMYAVTASRPMTGDPTLSTLFIFPRPGECLRLQTSYDSLLPSARISSDRSGNRTVNASPDDSLSPSEAAVAYQQILFRNLQSQNRCQEEWMRERYRQTDTDSLYFRLHTVSDSLFSLCRQQAIRLCRLYPGSLLPVFAVNKSWGNRPIIDPMNDEDWHLLYRCTESILQAEPGNPHAERLKFNLERIKSLQRDKALEAMEKAQKQTR